MKNLFVLIFIILLNQGCGWLEEDPDPQIEQQKKDMEWQKKIQEHKINLIANKRAKIFTDDDIEVYPVEIEGWKSITSLSNDGNNIIILTKNGSIYRFNTVTHNTKYLFNIQNKKAGGEDDLREAIFVYYKLNVITIGYYTNEIIDRNDSNQTYDSSNMIIKYRFKERKYHYPDGLFLEEVENPTKKQNISRPGQQVQYVLERNSIYRENLNGDDDSAIEILRKSEHSYGKRNVHFVGLSVLHNYCWVGTDDGSYIYKINIKLKDKIDELIEEEKNKQYY